MIRKTLTILSLIGLLLSVGLWAASYWDVGLTLASGLTMRTSDGLLHIGRKQPLGGGYGWRMTLAIWPASLIFALVMTLIIGRPVRRRRKREQLGLCLQCGYDLRASKERCPECNTPFDPAKLGQADLRSWRARFLGAMTHYSSLVFPLLMISCVLMAFVIGSCLL